MRKYRFNIGDKVRIHATKTSSVGCKEHDGEVVTIKSRCKFTCRMLEGRQDGLVQGSACP